MIRSDGVHDRRRLLRFGLATILGAFVAGCREDQPTTTTHPQPAGEGRTPNPESVAAGKLTARPGISTPTAQIRTGLQSLGITRRAEDAILYVPATYTHETPAPLVVMFHGAGGDAHGILSLLRGPADAYGTIVLAIDSVDVSWDIVNSGGFGADIQRLDLALQTVFSRFAVDPGRIALAGFSDGASYALSVGATNGGLAGAIIAFSPGFFAPGTAEGRPRIFIAHGTLDVTLPIDQTSRVIAPQLTDAGYDVEYVEFSGVHSMPSEIVDRALTWWLGGG
jgi:predicted esterase